LNRVTFNSSDFVPYLQTGTRVLIMSDDPVLNGKAGIIKSDRLDFNTLPESLKDVWPLRTVYVEDLNQDFVIREKCLERLKIDS